MARILNPAYHWSRITCLGRMLTEGKGVLVLSEGPGLRLVVELTVGERGGPEADITVRELCHQGLMRGDPLSNWQASIQGTCEEYRLLADYFATCEPSVLQTAVWSYLLR